MLQRILYISILVLLAEWTTFGAEPFFQDGRTVWKIYLSPQAEQTEVYAAKELQVALKKISGADFEVIAEENPPESNVIIIGDLKNPQVQAQAGALKLSAGKVEEVAVYTLGGRLYLAGNQPRGALYAVYSFLQRELGVRWLWPGADGEFIPVKTSWSLPELKFNHKPGFQYRGFHLCGDYYLGPDSEIFREWMARNFINIYRHAAPLKEKRRGFYSMWSSHNISIPKPLFSQHQEYFAEVKGKRYDANICFSNPEVDKIVFENLAGYVLKHPYLDILSVFPSDTTVYCRCENCSKTDPSTTWFEFYNRLTDSMKNEFPSLKLATIAYFEYRNVPKCKIRNTEFIEYCSYTRCNIHPYGQAGCKHNEDTMNAMLEWKATGFPIGNDAYEFDIFRRNSRFTPFLSLIDDAIKTSKKLGHVTMIPEVLLISPKYVPAEEYIFNVQQRLPIYLYARLLWDPDQKLPDILHDWCQTAFGEAALPMYDYYMSMDRAWSAMPNHTTILGDALNIAPHLFAGKLENEAHDAFSAAEKCLPKIENRVARDRVSANIERERVLFKQWHDLYMMTDSIPWVLLPLLAQAADFAQSSSAPQELLPAASGAKSYPATVSLAWTKEALLVRWICQDPEIKNMKATAAGHDGKVVEDDSVELVLSSGLSGETWYFGVNPKGTRQDHRISSVGTREDLWNPAWQAKTQVGEDKWEAEMTIPFASLGQTPNANEFWQARFIRHNGGRKDFENGGFPERDMSMLVFTSAASAGGSSILWWSGNPVRESRSDIALRQEFSKIGRQVQIVTTAEKLFELHPKCDVFWFRHPGGPNKVPADYWEKYLVPSVKNGAIAIFASYGNIPVDQYFKDPSMKVKTVGIENIPEAARRTNFIAPGDWSGKPNNLLHDLKSGITPANLFIPADTNYWTILASAPRNGNESAPYLLVRPYGKGLIVLCPDKIHRVSNTSLLENLTAYHKSLNQQKETGKKP
ncbi:MAG TPA: hypothetical protein DET40_05360 [Lentisphaeria bacterium]|nr:MAG: hypothetical protein A2X45_21955 [Lentisphaerae bacterium GWF2_50_93]HCE42955.1 hypothetical protein [Lentisphaeria bacterium]